MSWIFCRPITNFAVWKGSLLNIQLTCSYMQAPGNAVEGLGRSEGTPGSRCPPSEQPTPLPNPKDARPFRTLLSWKTSLPRWPLGRPLWMTFCSSRTTGRVQQLSCCHWKAGIDPGPVQNWPPNAHPCPPASPMGGLTWLYCIQRNPV